MNELKWLRTLLIGTVLIVMPLTANALRLADGNDWSKSTDSERRAYLVGISNMISVGNAYDTKKVPGEDRTFMRKSYRGLSHTTIPEAMQRVNEWYRENPGRMDVPVLSVLWMDIVKPRLAENQ